MKKDKNQIKLEVEALLHKAKSLSIKLQPNVIKKALFLLKRHTIRLSSQQRRQLCRNCHIYLISGKTSQTRIKEKVLITTCKVCGRMYKFKQSK
jgi:RNase P subunit RPR2